MDSNGPVLLKRSRPVSTFCWHHGVMENLKGRLDVQRVKLGRFYKASADIEQYIRGFRTILSIRQPSMPGCSKAAEAEFIAAVERKKAFSASVWCRKSPILKVKRRTKTKDSFLLNNTSR